MTVDFDRASETKMDSTSFRNDLMCLVYDDVVENEVEIALPLYEKYEVKTIDQIYEIGGRQNGKFG